MDYKCGVSIARRKNSKGNKVEDFQGLKIGFTTCFIPFGYDGMSNPTSMGSTRRKGDGKWVEKNE